MFENKFKVAAIIAEYNPFHNGHKYHIEETKRLTGADFVIVLMSGDFVQRGIPAIYDKYVRSLAALKNGADIVIELPTIYATGSAEYFAKGAVNILDGLGVVDYLSFGSESGDIDVLKSEASKRLSISSTDHQKIKELLKEGTNYAVALNRVLGSDSTVSDFSNNILAIEYLKALSLTRSCIIPFTVKRDDNGYTSESFSINDDTISASAIRKLISDKNDEFKKYIPSLGEAFEGISHFNKTLSDENAVQKSFFDTAVFLDDFSDILYYKLISEKEQGFTSYLDVDENLSGRIINNLENYTSISKFIDDLKTKNYTYTRISRALIHILLDIKNEDASLLPSYVRLLGFRKEAAPILHQIKDCSKLALISKLSDAEITPMLSKDIFASSIYQQINKGHRNEFRMSPIIID